MSHLTYDDVWQGYCDGTVSTVVLVAMMRRDEVFAAWCRRKVQAIHDRVKGTNRTADDEYRKHVAEVKDEAK